MGKASIQTYIIYKNAIFDNLICNLHYDTVIL